MRVSDVKVMDAKRAAWSAADTFVSDNYNEVERVMNADPSKAKYVINVFDSRDEEGNSVAVVEVMIKFNRGYDAGGPMLYCKVVLSDKGSVAVLEDLTCEVSKSLYDCLKLLDVKQTYRRRCEARMRRQACNGAVCFSDSLRCQLASNSTVFSEDF